MKDEIISFKTAKLAKEKGFEFIGNYYHINDGYKLGYALCYSNSDSKENCLVPAPTQSLLQRWLREKHNIDVLLESGYHYVIYETYNYEKEEYNSGIGHNDLNIANGQFISYEEALEEGLYEALKLIK
jgi:hypothetical protein